MPARLAAVLATLTLGCDDATRPAEWLTIENADARLEYQAADQSHAATWLELAATGRRTVAAFFGQAVDGPYRVRAYPDRPAFEALWRANGFQPACWMIGRATRDGVEVLAPRLWAGESCGHTEAEAGAVLTHELTHVLHANRNALSEVNYNLDLKWFNEGVAVYVAGQLTEAMRSQARTWARSHLGGGLAGLGSSGDTYAVGATLVELLDRRQGRAALGAALEATSTAALFTSLGGSETEWVARLAGGGSIPPNQ